MYKSKSRYAPYPEQPSANRKNLKAYKYPIIAVPIISAVEKKYIDEINSKNVKDNASNMQKYRDIVTLYNNILLYILFEENYNKDYIIGVINNFIAKQNIQHLARLKTIVESYRGDINLHETIIAILMNIGRPDNLEKKDINVKLANTIYNYFLCALVKTLLTFSESADKAKNTRICIKVRELVLAIEEQITGDFYQFQDINGLITSAKSTYNSNTFINKIFDKYQSHVPSSYKDAVKNALFDTNIEYKIKKYTGNAYMYEDSAVLNDNIRALKKGYELSKSGEQPIFCNSGYEMQEFHEIFDEFEKSQENLQTTLDRIKKSIDDGDFNSDELRLKYFIGCLKQRLDEVNIGKKRFRFKEEIKEFTEILMDLFNSNLEFNIWSYDNGSRVCYKVKNTHISILCNILIDKLEQSGGKPRKNVKDTFSINNNKIYIGPKGGKYYIIKKDGKSIKRYITIRSN
jgi:hypothetical protein